jgi:hypothetical protein
MTSAITRLRLLGDNADELTKWQADVELREAKNERERARKEREARAQQASNDWTNWYARIDERIAEHFKLNFSRDGWLTDSIGGAIGKHTRKVADDLVKEIAALREELRAATSKLQERHARLPLVKSWQADTVHYLGDVVVCNGSVYQAKRDTGRPVTSDDWILLARAGRDGLDGFVPIPCGTFDADKTYGRLDIVECDGASYVARYTDPGICPGDGWQLLSGPGRRGPTGETGPRGEKGERGARGEAAPTIISWVVDVARYRAFPTSDAWGRLNVVTPFHHLSGDSHLHRSLGAGPITASKANALASAQRAHHQFAAFISSR